MSTVIPESESALEHERAAQSESRPTKLPVAPSTPPLPRHDEQLLGATLTSQRTERLVTITAALAQAVAPQQVFEAVVDQVAAALGASSAALFQLRESEGTVELVHAVGYSEERQVALRSLPLDFAPSFPALDTIRTGSPLWFSSQQELLKRYPHLHSLVSPGRSYHVACLPILADERTLGTLAFTFDDSPPLDRDQQDFLLLVTRYCAQALERLRMLAQAQEERGRAERAAARAGLLSRASRAFAEAGKELPTVLQAVVEQVTKDHAEFCGVSLVSGEHLKLEAMHHRNPEAKQLLWEVIEASPPKLAASESGRVIETGQSVHIPDFDAALIGAVQCPEHRAWLQRYTPRSIIIAPLRVRARIIGTVAAVRHVGSESFTQDDVRFLEELGERAAMAIESSRLYHESLESRARAELLYGLARAVIEAIEITSVFDAALDALERALGAQRSAILTYDAGGVMRFRAWRGLSEQYRQAVEGHAPWSRDEHEPQPVLIPDALRDERVSALKSVLEQEHIGSLGFFPLLDAGQLVGKFMVYYDSPRELRHQEMEMAVAIANHVAAAVSRFSAVASLQETVKFNEMFTGMLGHDLRNPLGAIMTSAQVAIRRVTDERANKPLQRIITSGQRMARMIDQLLDFTRVRVGSGMPVEPAPVDLLILLRQVIDEFDGTAQGAGVRLTHEGETSGSWDADRLSQVFSNLIANALHHGEPAFGVHVHVDGKMPERVRTEVHNLGAIPEDLVPNLFEPMTGGEHRRHRSDGLGLGLYITHQIIKAHGGSIEATSNAANGTTFTTLLPRVSDVSPQSERRQT